VDGSTDRQTDRQTMKKLIEAFRNLVNVLQNEVKKSVMCSLFEDGEKINEVTKRNCTESWMKI
jgi:hypothetical protein